MEIQNQLVKMYKNKTKNIKNKQNVYNPIYTNIC